MTELSVTLYTSSFCGACTAARATAERAAELLGDRVEWREVNVADAPDEAERARITATPTLVIRAVSAGDGDASVLAPARSGDGDASVLAPVRSGDGDASVLAPARSGEPAHPAGPGRSAHPAESGDDAGLERFRASGVPTVPQLLTAIAGALPA